MGSKEIMAVCGWFFGMGLYALSVMLMVVVAGVAFSRGDALTAALVIGILLMSIADSILDGPVAKAIRECIAERRADD